MEDFNHFLLTFILIGSEKPCDSKFDPIETGSGLNRGFGGEEK